MRPQPDPRNRISAVTLPGRTSDDARDGEPSRAALGKASPGDALTGDPAPARRDETFPRSRRLTKEAEFRAVLTRGYRNSSLHLVVYLLPNDLPEPRLGLTVSRKVGNAVARQRVKRRLREAFRRGWRFLLADHPADMLVRALPGAASAPAALLAAEGERAVLAWRRAGCPVPARRGRRS